MGVFTFVCRNSDGQWNAKQIGAGNLEGSAGDAYSLQRSLIQAAVAKDSSGGVQSSFSMVTPTSAVFQVIIGGGFGGGFIGGAALGGAPAASGGAPAASGGRSTPVEEKKEEEKEEESDDDMIISDLFGE